MCAWRVWGESFSDASDLTSTRVFQPVRFNKNVILKGVRTWVVVYNNPTFTNLNMKIYSNDAQQSSYTPKEVVSTSNDVRTKSEIHTLSNAVKEIYFTFDDIPLNGEDFYNFVINGTGYSPTSSSYLAWMKGFPDPVYDEGLPAFTMVSIGGAPFQIYFIAGEF